MIARASILQQSKPVPDEIMFVIQLAPFVRLNFDGREVEYDDTL
jgi:hypothetical protein